MGDHIEPDIVRSPQEVARRALTLFSIVGLALGAPKSEITEWLQGQGLTGEFAPSERRFFEAPNPSEKEIVAATWLSERLIVLCWALCHIERLPPPDQPCDTAEFQNILPPFAEVEVSEFIDGARLRPDRELIAMADTVLRLHGEARNLKLSGTPPRLPVDIEIVQERHHAINWVIGYDGAPWDEVTTDT